jgi:hypothetical protein
VIYGPWADPFYQLDYWYPPPIFGYPDLSAGFAVGIFFGAGRRISHNHWGWAHANWRGHDIDVNLRNNNFANRPEYINRWRDGQWAHSPEHRHGVAYRDSGSQDRYIRPNTAAIQAREPYRGRDLAPPQQAGARPAPPPQQGIVRSPSEAQPFARPAPQGIVRSPSEAQPFARAVPEAPQGIVRPSPQPQPFARFVPPPQQAIARPAPQLQPMTRPMLQQYAPQPAYAPQPRAQVQMDTNRGQISRQTNSAPSAPQRGGQR